MSAWKPYDPQKPKRARNISDQEWSLHKGAIASMYRESYTHAEMLEILRTHWDFNPSKSQLVARLKTWGFMGRSRSSDREPDHSISTGLDVGNNDEPGQELDQTRPVATQCIVLASSLQPAFGSPSENHSSDGWLLTNADIEEAAQMYQNPPGSGLIDAQSKITRLHGLGLKMGISLYWLGRIKIGFSIPNYMEQISMLADILGLSGNHGAANSYYGFLIHCFPESCHIGELALGYRLTYETYRIRFLYCGQNRHLLPSNVLTPSSIAKMHQQNLPPLAEVGDCTRQFLTALTVLSDPVAAESRKHLSHELSHVTKCPHIVELISCIRAWLFAMLWIDYQTVHHILEAAPDRQSFICRLLSYLFEAWRRFSTRSPLVVRYCDDCGSISYHESQHWQLRMIACMIFNVNEYQKEIRGRNLTSTVILRMLNRLCSDAVKSDGQEWDHLVESMQGQLSRGKLRKCESFVKYDLELNHLVSGRSYMGYIRLDLTSADMEHIEALLAKPRSLESYVIFQSYVTSQVRLGALAPPSGLIEIAENGFSWKPLETIDELAEDSPQVLQQDHDETLDADGESSETGQQGQLPSAMFNISTRLAHSLGLNTSNSDRDEEMRISEERKRGLLLGPIPGPERSHEGSGTEVGEKIIYPDAAFIENTPNLLSLEVRDENGPGPAFSEVRDEDGPGPAFSEVRDENGPGPAFSEVRDENGPRPAFSVYGEYLPKMVDGERASSGSAGRSSLRSLLSLMMRARNLGKGNSIDISSGGVSFSTHSSWSLRRAAGYDAMSIVSKSSAPSMMSVAL